MESLKTYVCKRLDRYDDDRKNTLKCILQFMGADSILVSDYCKLYLNKSLDEVNSKEVIKHMVLNSPWGYSYRNNDEQVSSEVSVPKKRVLSFNDDFERDEILND